MNGRFLLLGFVVLLVGGFFMAYRISNSGINKIKKHEALRLEPYKDSAGLWTIGYGHLLKKGEWWDSITEEFAEELLRQDLAIAERAVNDYVLVPINQNQYDALVSLVFNIGIGNFKKSTLLKKINNGNDKDDIANEFLRWKKAGGYVIPGLLARREVERELFLA